MAAAPKMIHPRCGSQLFYSSRAVFQTETVLRTKCLSEFLSLIQHYRENQEIYLNLAVPVFRTIRHLLFKCLLDLKANNSKTYQDSEDFCDFIHIKMISQNLYDWDSNRAHIESVIFHEISDDLKIH